MARVGPLDQNGSTMMPKLMFIETALDRVNAGRSRCGNAQYVILTVLAAFESLRRTCPTMHTEEPTL
ncbi:MAG: hypothetical protein ACI9DC_000720 [Gammaproteobacteria bacterium]|jgi:hypothetical protein